MRRLRLVLLLVVGVLVAATPVRAELAGDADAVVFVGSTTAWTPLPIVGGTGTYGFGSNFCVVASATTDGDEGAPGQARVLCTAGLSGTYAFVVCMTGTMSGTGFVNELSLLDPTSATQYQIRYSITVVAGLGVFTGTASEDGGVTFPDPVAGVVAFSTATPPALPLCVTQLTVEAALVSTV
jgi:hypothetical protein